MENKDNYFNIFLEINQAVINNPKTRPVSMNMCFKLYILCMKLVNDNIAKSAVIKNTKIKLFCLPTNILI